MSKKKKGLFLLIAVLVISISTTVYAGTFSNLKVTKLVDGETPTETKYKGYTEALIEINYMSQTGKNYEVFVEHETGYNVTAKKTIDSPKIIQIAYDRGLFDNSTFKAKLNITTAVNNFTTGYFSGKWTPNHDD